MRRLSREGRVVDEVVLLQRLLDQQQVEAVELGEGGGIGQRVGRVGVDLQRDRSERIAHRGGLGDVATGLDLDLDPHVSLVEIAAHDLDERRGVALDADGHAGRHPVVHGAEVLPQRSALAAQRRVEHRELQAGLGHAVPDERCERACDRFGRQRVAIEQGGDEPAGSDIPRSLRVLARVQRRGAGHDLAPAVAVGREGPREDDLAHGLGAERRRERRDQRDLQHAELETLEGHRCRGSGDGHALRLRRAVTRTAKRRSRPGAADAAREATATAARTAPPGRRSRRSRRSAR